MTTVEYEDRLGTSFTGEEIYEVTGKTQKDKLSYLVKREEEIVKDIESRGGKVVSVDSEFISKRRYKRRRAKMLKKLNKKY